MNIKGNNCFLKGARFKNLAILVLLNVTFKSIYFYEMGKPFLISHNNEQP